MRKLLSIVSVICVLAIVLTSVTAQAATIKLSKKKAVMEVDSTLKLKITGTKANVTWTTSKKSVATVSNAGTVTAKAEGKATITATVNSKKYSCKVTVVDSNKATPTPIPTDTPRISPTPTPIPEPSSDMAMLNETEIKDLTLHPDKYLGKYAEFPAKIITEPVVDGSVYSCLICQDMEKNTKIIYIEYFDRPGLKKGDKLLFFGYLETMYHGPGVDGNNIEAPLMIIKGMSPLDN